MTETGLRERKKQRTRRALFEAALRSFSERGYEQTTIADIAAAADVAPRTFFSYYPSKEHAVFYDADDRAALALGIIADRRPGETPVELLVRAMREVVGLFRGASSPRAEVERMRLIKEVPALHAYQLRLLHDAQYRLSDALLTACPGELDPLDARIAASVVMSAVFSAAMFALESDVSEDMRLGMADRAISLVVHGFSSIDHGGPQRGQ